MKKIKIRFYTAVLIVLGITLPFIIANQLVVQASSNTVHTIKFNNNLQIKTLFYPYRDPANVFGNAAIGLQGLTTDGNNIYLTYATGDKNHYGYIYKYRPNGTLLKKSSLLTIGHGQAISYKNGYLYQLADIRGQASYTLQKINLTTLKVIRTWKIPSTIHPNVISMQDSNTAIGISKVGDGYDINKIHLGTSYEATRYWQEKIHIDGLIGKTAGKEIQGFTFGNGQYYLLSNGEYMTFNSDGTNMNRVSLNTTREPEGIAITQSGKIMIAFNKLNEIFLQK